MGDYFKLTDEGRPGPLWVVLSPRHEVLTYKSEETELNISQQVGKCVHPFLSAFDCGSDVTSCLKSLP